MAQKQTIDAMWDDSPIDVSTEVNFIWSVQISCVVYARMINIKMPSFRWLSSDVLSVRWNTKTRWLLV